MGSVIDRSADVELDFAVGEFVGYGPGVGDRAGESIEFGDNQDVPGTYSGECFAQARSVRSVPVRP